MKTVEKGLKGFEKAIFAFLSPFSHLPFIFFNTNKTGFCRPTIIFVAL